MSERARLLVVAVVALAVLVYGLTRWPGRKEAPAEQEGPAAVSVSEIAPFQARVVDFGVVVYEGTIDIKPTLQRIREGRRIKGRTDGGTFWNREGKLPVENDPRYYREYILWDEKINAKLKERVLFPGPQRLVIGKGGEVYYSGDHYETWKRVK